MTPSSTLLRSPPLQLRSLLCSALLRQDKARNDHIFCRIRRVLKEPIFFFFLIAAAVANRL